MDCKLILAREKYNQLKLLFRYTEVRIGCFAGGNKPRGGVEAYDVLICTIEKANFILNYLKTEDKLGMRFKSRLPTIVWPILYGYLKMAEKVLMRICWPFVKKLILNTNTLQS